MSGCCRWQACICKAAFKKPTDFINRKQSYYINVQAINNYGCCFIDVVFEWSECLHDTRIFSNSSINGMLQDGITPPFHRTIADDLQLVPLCLLGDPAHQLLPYLMKEYPTGGKDVDK